MIPEVFQLDFYHWFCKYRNETLCVWRYKEVNRGPITDKIRLIWEKLHERWACALIDRASICEKAQDASSHVIDAYQCRRLRSFCNCDYKKSVKTLLKHFCKGAKVHREGLINFSWFVLNFFTEKTLKSTFNFYVILANRHNTSALISMYKNANCKTAHDNVWAR